MHRLLLVTGLLVGGLPSLAPLVAYPPASAAARLPERLATVPRVVDYRAPLDGALVVVRPFTPPSGPYGAGHRGVDLRTTSLQVVRAAGRGVVTFAGVLAGRGVVVVAHADGMRTEYEPLSVLVRAGETIPPGAVIGRVSGRHDTCAPGRCLHWSARRGTVYVDPLTLLQPLGVVRLVPLDG